MNTDITTTFKNYVNNGGTLHYRATLTLNNSSKTTLQLGDNDFLQDTWEFQYDSCEGDFAIGGAVPSQFKCTLNNLTGKFTNYVSYLDGGTITVYLQSVKETETYNEKTCLVTKTFTKDEEFCWGTFIVNVDFQHYETIDLQCYDRLYLLQQTNLFTFLNGLPNTEKIDTLSRGNASYILSLLKTWLTDFGITNVKCDLNLGSFKGYFLLPKEFFASTYSPSGYLVKQNLNPSRRVITSDYDFSYFSKSETWEDKTLLDFVRYFAQVFGLFVSISSDGSTLNMFRYSLNTTIADSVNYKNIKNITYAPIFYSNELCQCCVKTIDDQVGVVGAPSHNPCYSNINCTLSSTVSEINLSGIVGNASYSTSFAGEVSTGNYEILNHSSSLSYLSVEDNPLIILPVGDRDWAVKTSDGKYARWYGVNLNTWSTGSNYYAKSPTLLYNTSNDLGWYVDKHTDPVLISAAQIVCNYSSTASSSFNTMTNLTIRDFECSAVPKVGFRVGNCLKFYYDNNGHSFITIVNHIVFKPNLSIKFSTSFDKDNAIKNFTGLSCDSYGKRRTAFQKFYEDMRKKIGEMYKKVVQEQEPTISYRYSKWYGTTTDYSEGSYTSTNMTSNDEKFCYNLLTTFTGETVGSYKTSSTRSGSNVVINFVKNTN